MKYEVSFSVVIVVDAMNPEEAEKLGFAQLSRGKGLVSWGQTKQLESPPPLKIPTLYTVGVVYGDGSYVTLLPPSPEFNHAVEYRPQFVGALILCIEADGKPVPIRSWDGTKWEEVS